ncbi:jg13510 [Pararge aegeria aegeria]|uniref:Jg13510 protein n=2 Tax=Pararge aegeria TaxID=116150 RepID=A0A8S4QS64_9NEOP|nr:jg13510 [Pararge aegeria aegeria]
MEEPAEVPIVDGLIVPKQEILDELDINDDCVDSKDFIIPKKELCESNPNSDTDEKNSMDMFRPIKTETTLSKEIVHFQKIKKSPDNEESNMNTDVSSQTIAIDIKVEPVDEASVPAESSTTPGATLSKSRDIKSAPLTSKNVGDANSKTKSTLAVRKVFHTGDKLLASERSNQELLASERAKQEPLNSELCERQVHSRKPHKCNLCSMKFAHKSRLSAHMLTHTGEKPFECKLCDMKFTHKNGVTVHMRTHTGEKPYECKFCSMKFAQRGSLTYHTRTHTGEKPFSCTHCDMRFARRNCLTEHLLTHTGDKPFECNLCLKKFVRKTRFTTHMLTHTGKKYDAVDTCVQTNERSDDLDISDVKKEWEVPIVFK